MIFLRSIKGYKPFLFKKKAERPNKDKQSDSFRYAQAFHKAKKNVFSCVFVANVSKKEITLQQEMIVTSGTELYQCVIERRKIRYGYLTIQPDLTAVNYRKVDNQQNRIDGHQEIEREEEKRLQNCWKNEVKIAMTFN